MDYARRSSRPERQIRHLLMTAPCSTAREALAELCQTYWYPLCQVTLPGARADLFIAPGVDELAALLQSWSGS